MKIQIVTHLLPHELDEFERQLCTFSQCELQDMVVLDVTLNMNTFDDSSTIHRQFFINKFNQLCDYVTKTKWCKSAIFDVNHDGTCRGVNDKRRNSIRTYANTVDAFLYLDSDVIFPPHALPYIIHCAKQVKNQYYIVTPQIPKIWDHTWDHLVNDAFVNEPYGFEKKVNPYQIVNQSYGDVYLTKSPNIKIGGGWFNLISSSLLMHTNIPDDLGPYGVDDTYVMYCAQIMKHSGKDVEQYIMNNIVVAENYLLRHNPYKHFIKYKEGRDDFKSVAESNLRKCLVEFQQNNNYVLTK